MTYRERAQEMVEKLSQVSLNHQWIPYATAPSIDQERDQDVVEEASILFKNMAQAIDNW